MSRNTKNTNFLNLIKYGVIANLKKYWKQIDLHSSTFINRDICILSIAIFSFKVQNLVSVKQNLNFTQKKINRKKNILCIGIRNI